MGNVVGNVVKEVGLAVVGFFLKVSQMITGAPPKAQPPSGIRNVNDYVWELYSPKGMPEMEIIFFHGLQMGDFEDAFWKTWLAKDDEQLVWPQHWLSKKFPNARILSISYNSSATRPDEQPDMYRLGENLVDSIITDDPDYSIGQNCPVFLVGHSLGGIVIKQFILSAIRKRDTLPDTLSLQAPKTRIITFLQKFKGVFYYGTPHGGSEIANLARRIPHINPVLELLKTLDTERVRINEEFRQQRDNFNAQAYAVAECQPISKFGFHAVVVSEASARHDIDQFFTHTTSNHFTVCKARSMDDPTVIGKLTHFIRGAMPEGYVMRPQQDEQVLDPDHLE